MTVLRELTESGRRKVERTLEDGDPVGTIDESTFREYSVPIEGVTADLDALGDELQAITDGREYSVEIDALAAPVLHQHLDISRREASNDGLWHWLSAAKFADFVYDRWKESGDIQEKFLAAGTDIYSNALHRLWWGAELTRRDGEYELTEAMFSSGELANDVLDRWFARYRSGAQVTVEFLQDEDSETISDTTTDLRNELSVYSLELMTEEEIEDLLNRL